MNQIPWCYDCLEKKYICAAYTHNPYSRLVAQNFVDLLHELIVLPIGFDRIQTHSYSASFRLDVSNLCSVRELGLAKTTGEVWWGNTLQESITLLSDILLCDVSANSVYA